MLQFLILVTSFLLLMVRPGLALQNWSWQNPSPQGNNLYGVYFTSSDTGTVVGGDGVILRTTDAGATWVRQKSGTTNFLRGVYFANPDFGIIIGIEGTLLRTTDGGDNWVPLESWNKQINSGTEFYQ